MPEAESERPEGGGVPLVALERGRRQGGHDHQMGPRLVTASVIADIIFFVPVGCFVPGGR